jgi:hypothetical protein
MAKLKFTVRARAGLVGRRGLDGLWGDDPPFHTPVFVLTHPREPVLRPSENS